MINIPTGFQAVISQFSFAFRKDVWEKAILLLIGAIICPGSRTVCNILRCVGLSWEKNFPKYHRLLSTDKWSAKQLSELLLRLVINAFIPQGEAIVFGLDDTIERRWGHKISKRGIYRDPVRSSKSHFVKCSGLRWLSLMVLTSMPWLEKGAYWALPILTILCPSKRYYADKGKQVKKLTDWASQILSWIYRYCKSLKNPLYLATDGSFAVLELFIKSQQFGIGLIARMKLNARLYDLPTDSSKKKPGPKPPVGEKLSSMKELLTTPATQWTRVTFSDWYGHSDKEMLMISGVSIWRKSNTRLVKIKWVLLKDPDDKLEPTLLGCSNFEADDKQIVQFFVRRWRVEVTFAEVRRHLGVETQRQWSDQAIDRTTPCLFACFSIVCLLGKTLYERQKFQPNQTAWYKKKDITFSDVLTAVRLEIFQKSELFKRDENPLFKNYSDNVRTLWFLLTQATA